MRVLVVVAEVDAVRCAWPRRCCPPAPVADAVARDMEDSGRAAARLEAQLGGGGGGDGGGLGGRPAR